MVRIGELVQQAREEKQMLQRDLARTIGVSVKTVSRWENHERVPSRAKLAAIAAATGKPLSWFLGDAEDNAPTPPAADRPQAPLANEPGFAALLRDTETCAQKGIVGQYAVLLARIDLGGTIRTAEQALALWETIRANIEAAAVADDHAIGQDDGGD